MQTERGERGKGKGEMKEEGLRRRTEKGMEGGDGERQGHGSSLSFAKADDGAASWVQT